MFGERFRRQEDAPDGGKWDGLALPEMGPTVEGCSNGQGEWRTERNGLKLRFWFQVSRQEVDYSTRKASVDFYCYDENGKDTERIATFKLACNEDSPGKYYDSSRNSDEDKGIHRFWQVYYRRVEKDYRHKGLGTLGVQLMERLVAMMGEKDPAVKGEWIQMDTQLASVARLISDHEWLKRSGLGEYADESRPDFGYLPHPKDVQDAYKLITGVSEELNDVVGKNVPQVRFRKQL